MELVSALATLSSGPLAISTIYKSLVRMSDSELLTSHVNDDDMGRALSRAPHAEEWTAARVAEVFLADKPPIKQWPSEMSVSTGTPPSRLLRRGLCDFGAVERGFAVSRGLRAISSPRDNDVRVGRTRANFPVGSFSCVLHDYTLDEVRKDSLSAPALLSSAHAAALVVSRDPLPLRMMVLRSDHSSLLALGRTCCWRRSLCFQRRNPRQRMRMGEYAWPCRYACDATRVGQCCQLPVLSDTGAAGRPRRGRRPLDAMDAAGDGTDVAAMHGSPRAPLRTPTKRAGDPAVSGAMAPSALLGLDASELYALDV